MKLMLISGDESPTGSVFKLLFDTQRCLCLTGNTSTSRSSQLINEMFQQKEGNEFVLQLGISVEVDKATRGLTWVYCSYEYTNQRKLHNNHLNKDIEFLLSSI